MKSGICLVLIVMVVFGVGLCLIPLQIVSSESVNRSDTSESSSIQRSSTVSKTVSGATSDATSNAVASNSSGMAEEGLTSLKLIDVSHKNVITDWDEVQKKIDGIYIKATEGTTYTDPSFDTYAKMASSRNIPIGFYHYFWPTGDISYSRQQADYFYNTIKKYHYEFYPVLDTEESNNQNKQTISNDVEAFCDEFNKVSKEKVMIYCSPKFINQYLDNQELKKYPLWIADYGVESPSDTTVWHTYDMWQYGIDNSIPGINGAVDGDIATNNILINK